jgi:hypothetical protein
MFRKTLIARALTIAFGGAALTFGVIAPVMAQSNATGNIVGRVDNAASTSITIFNTETGLQRTITPGADGRFSATSLPTGHYKVTLSRAGAVVSSQEVDVLLGKGVDASFDLAAQNTVKITGRRQTIDVSSTTNGATFTAKQLKSLPITPNVDSIIQLASNTTRADSRYAAGASFGGGGASENAYYINGFPTTNPLTQLGASELPFGAIAQAELLTGGFGAEFGRSVGGVVNLVTKSGTNNWEIGGSFAITPEVLRSKRRDNYYGVTGAPENAATDGTLRVRHGEDTENSYTVGAYVSGPIIKDKLFLFVAGEQISTRREGVNLPISSTSTGNIGWFDRKDETQRYLGKLDWFITDNHRLELTLIGDDSKRDEKLSGYTYNPDIFNGGPGTRNNTTFSSEHYSNNSNVLQPVGANVQILKYTGNLTDNLTLTALYGQSQSEHTNTYDGYDINQELFQVVAGTRVRAPGLNYTSPQALVGNILPAGAKDDVKSFRLDLEYKIGRHTIRGGLDDNSLVSTNAGEFSAGGGVWRYFRTTTGRARLAPAGTVDIASGGGLGVDGYYVRRDIFDDATSAESLQSAQYIEDKFQITKNFLLTGGLRSEEFSNKNGAGETFLEQKNQIAPRLAASWDVHGDQSLKLFGTAGRYHLQIPTHVAVRGASASLNTREYFTYTGTDANGNPTGLNPLTGLLSNNNEFGQDKDPLVVSAVNLKPTFQDEITFGFEKSVSPTLNIGSKVTYRELKSTIDDFCDDRQIRAWADRNGVSTVNWRGFNCASFNPGSDTDLLVDFNDLVAPRASHTLVHLTKDELGIPKAKRAYLAVDFFVEHPFRDGWYAKAYYTWSRSKGNTEGQTLSDVAQTDVAVTQTWDNYELSDFTDGLLPNDRTHQIKAFGFYEINKQWIVGGNLLAASGRPINCLGNYAGPSLDFPDYGSAYRYCDDKPTPRGSLGKLPWDIRLDLNVVYKPEIIKGLALKVDVFNFFNKQTTQTVDEVYNSGSDVADTYGRIISYTAPRTVRLTAEYNHKF